MKKEIITYRKEIITNDTGAVVARSLKRTVQVEDMNPKYVVMNTNYEGAMISGVPCKIIGKPYIKQWKEWDYNRHKFVYIPTEVIDLQSCVTGYTYTVPNKKQWREEFISRAAANQKAKVYGHLFPQPTNLLDRPYWPKDNSYITEVETGRDISTTGLWRGLIYKHCVIASTPYEGVYKNPFGDDYKGMFIKVWYNHKLYQVPFHEWSLHKPGFEATLHF